MKITRGENASLKVKISEIAYSEDNCNSKYYRVKKY